MGGCHALSKRKGSATDAEKAGKCTVCTASCARSQEASRNAVLLILLLLHKKSLVVVVQVVLVKT